MRGGGKEGAGQANGLEEGAGDGGPGVVVDDVHLPVDEPEVQAGEEEEHGDKNKPAGEKGATGTNFVGTRLQQMKKDAQAAAQKALQGQKVSSPCVAPSSGNKFCV